MATSKPVFIDRSAMAKKKLMDILDDNLVDFAEHAHSLAMKLVPVNTGNLKSNLRLEISQGGKGFRIYTSAGYGGYVELGTVNMAARAYIKPSIGQAQRDFERQLARDGKNL